MIKRITHDFETKSEEDLTKVGAYKYSLHPSTRATCLAAKAHGSDKIWFLDYNQINLPWSELPESFRFWWTLCIEEGYEFSAHNSFFERCVYDNILVKRLGWPPIPPRLRRCTAAKAAALAIPRALGPACEVMQLRTQKDHRGYQAMMATCKPSKLYRDWIKTDLDLKSGKKLGKKRLSNHTPKPPPMFLTPEAAPEVFQVLYEYCRIDVLAEEELDDTLPDLSPAELEIWHHNQLLNWRGLRFDRPMVLKIVDIMKSHEEKKSEELDELTIGFVKSAACLKDIMEFLAEEGVELPNLQAKTIENAIKNMDLSVRAKELLEIRKALSMASTKKYAKFLERGTDDGRVRDILLYHGASTGRESGVGINPNNFVKRLIPQKDVEEIVEILQRPNFSKNEFTDYVEFFYGSGSLGTVCASILRSVIIPDDGHDMVVADFSKIELAINWWLADHSEGLKILRAGKDPYKFQAMLDTGKKYDEITDEERFFAKAKVLGLGYGMGPAKFQSTIKSQNNIDLSIADAREAVYGFRKTNPAVPELWKKYEIAAVKAITNKKATYMAGKCMFFMDGRFLKIRLPSGRCLSYLDPRISWVETEFGPRRQIEFLGLDKSKKKMQLERTWGGTLTENVCQSVARDIMMPAMRRLEKRGYQALLSVYDEGLCQVKRGKGSIEEFKKIMTEVPSWAEGLPLTADGWIGPRYKK